MKSYKSYTVPYYGQSIEKHVQSLSYSLDNVL